MQERIKEHEGIYDSPVPRPLPFLSAATRPAIIRFGSEVKFIDQDSHWYTRSVKEAIRIRLLP